MSKSRKKSSSVTNTTTIDNSDHSFTAVSGKGSVGKVGNNSNVVIENLSDEVVDSAFSFGKEALSTTNKTAQTAINAVGENSARGFDFAKNLTGEAFEEIGESNERAMTQVNRAMNLGAQQTQAAVKSLTGVIERNQIGASAVQTKNMRSLMVMGGVVMVAMFMFAGRKK